ncbi:hypothetical protein GGR54DRAFT_637326 [Hypoxylon sp. NC1633]|nr:hypothetical protein GGR54DRAFT_637326 [Hypoxylon sp. NC1633]
MRPLSSRRVAACSAAVCCLASGANAFRDASESRIEILDDNAIPASVQSALYTDLHSCPAACGNSNSGNWTIYSSTERLAACDEPVLLDFNIYNPLDDPSTQTKLLACTPDRASRTIGDVARARRRGAGHNAHVCFSMASESNMNLDLSYKGVSTDKSNDLIRALEHLEAYFKNDGNCDTSILFGYSRGAAVGIYIGSAIDKASIHSVIEAIKGQVTDTAPASAAVQLCGNERNANHVFGIAFDTTDGLPSVQNAVASWNNAECVTGFDSSSQLGDLTVWEAHPTFKAADSLGSSIDEIRDATLRRIRQKQLNARGNACKTHSVVAGDTCKSLASACGITGADFTTYNPAEELCSSLAPGQHVCCSAGTLPSFRPKPRADGTCATYRVKSGDSCSSLATANGLTSTEIEKFNNGTDRTWGWNGCRSLVSGMNICLSSGDPPMPAPVANADCGPTMLGTLKPFDGTKLEDLNLCPLSARCNIWGQCGVGGDFYVNERGPSGNPGTAPPGVDGCASGCGADIKSIEDYRAWNSGRERVRLVAQDADADGSYTYIHRASVTIDTRIRRLGNVVEYGRRVISRYF